LLALRWRSVHALQIALILVRCVWPDIREKDRVLPASFCGYSAGNLIVAMRSRPAVISQLVQKPLLWPHLLVIIDSLRRRPDQLGSGSRRG